MCIAQTSRAVTGASSAFDTAEASAELPVVELGRFSWWKKREVCLMFLLVKFERSSSSQQRSHIF